LDGGTIKIVNKQFLKGLEVLNFSKEQIEDIEAFIVGHKTLVGAPHINHSTLFALGFSKKELDLIESLILKSNSLYEVFNKENFPSDFQRAITDRNNFSGDNLLELLGFSKEQIEECNKYCFGHDSLEGCPFLTEDQKRIFLTSVGPGPTLDPLAHLKMVAAVQPFISSGISKTVNLPASASVEDVEKIFLEAWKLGLKSVTVYRDQSKVVQPLNLARAEVQATEEHYGKPLRKPLPPKRRGYTQKVKIGGYSIFLRTGEYENGELGEIFLDISKEGTALGSIMNHFAIAVSIGLQYGVPLEEFVDAFLYTRYEPSGIVHGHPHIKFVTSISDFIFKDLAINYLDRKDLIQSSEAQAVDHSIKNDLSIDTRIFEGQPCPECGHFTLIRSGACLRCITCGLSKDCS
jgi:ribonucleoside-diphosphate reductase alpha chain